MNIFRPVTATRDRSPSDMSSDDFSDLPGILAEIAEAADREAAELIAEHRGGSRTYFPPSAALRTDHWLVGLVGAERAVKIAKAIADLHGLNVDVPLGPTGQMHQASRSRLALVRSMTLEGVPTNVIARHLGITDRGVRKIKTNLKQTGQLPTKAAQVAQRISSPRASGELVLTSDQEVKIKKLLRNGISATQIAERMGVSYTTVKAARLKLIDSES